MEGIFLLKTINTDIMSDYTKKSIAAFPRTLFRGVGQVMFQDNMWTGILFMAGIFWGSYEEGIGIVAWGALVGVIVSTLTGYVLHLSDQNGSQGLWGFNGVLVGCAFPTFLGNTVWMWIALVLCSASTTWARSGMDNVLGRWKISSLTFPFVVCTWVFLLASRLFAGMPAENMGTPEFADGMQGVLDIHFGAICVYWLKGIAQIFLINSWVTGIFFLAGLAVSSWRAAVWAGVSSAVALFVAIVWGAPGHDVANGLYGFSAVLTGIALGATFCNFSWKAAIWAVIGIVATVFAQGAMNSFFSPMGLPTLTGPFCLTTWMFLLPAYKFFAPEPGSAPAAKGAPSEPDAQKK